MAAMRMVRWTRLILIITIFADSWFHDFNYQNESMRVFVDCSICLHSARCVYIDYYCWIMQTVKAIECFDICRQQWHDAFVLACNCQSYSTITCCVGIVLHCLLLLFYFFCTLHLLFVFCINYISYLRWPALMGICLFWQPTMFKNCI